MKKTMKQWLNELPAPYKELVDANRKAQNYAFNDDVEFSSMSSAISSAFYGLVHLRGIHIG